MENLKAKSFDLRKDTVDIIVAGKGGHIGGDRYFDEPVFLPDEHFSGKHG